MKLTWYFDFISPFAYLQLVQFHKLPKNCEVIFKPVLLAGLLNHWNNTGPAEIPPKRIFTYQHCYWQARRSGIDFKMPPQHPFNSLAALRLAIAFDCKPEAIQIIFNAIWQQGYLFEEQACINYLAQHLKLTSNEINALVSAESVKLKLKQFTMEAAENNIFGVPTFLTHDDKNISFWGLDAFDMLLDYIHSPQLFFDQEMQRISQLPIGAQRQR